MAKFKILFLLSLMVLTLIGCSSNEDSNKSLFNHSDSERAVELVKNYYQNSSRKIEVKDLTIVESKPYSSGYLILAWYKGEGPDVTLFYIAKDKDEVIIKKKYTVEPATSMGFAVNKVFYGNNVILFSNLNEETWVPPNGDKRVKTDYSKMLVNASGKKINEDITGSEGYIVVLPNGEINDVILYNSQGEIVNTMEDLKKYGVIGQETNW